MELWTNYYKMVQMSSRLVSFSPAGLHCLVTPGMDFIALMNTVLAQWSYGCPFVMFNYGMFWFSELFTAPFHLQYYNFMRCTAAGQHPWCSYSATALYIYLLEHWLLLIAHFHNAHRHIFALRWIFKLYRYTILLIMNHLWQKKQLPTFS